MGLVTDVDPEVTVDRVQSGLFVNGRRQTATGDDRLHIEYPYTRQIWAAVDMGSAQDVDSAVAAARHAFDEGRLRDMPLSRRSELLRDIADVVEANADELAAIISKENGRLLRTMSAQVSAVPRWFRYYASLCQTIEGSTIPVENKGGQFLNYVDKVPHGVVGGITPWNGPLIVTTYKLAPALAAGNTFVHKPSEHTPLSTLRFAELIHAETDIPDGVYNVVAGDGRTTGAALASHPDVDLISFTGSKATGSQVAQAAAKHITPALLELGGKNANIVFESANLSNAVNGAIKGIFSGGGEVCTAGSRLFVQESIMAEFMETFLGRANDITLGDPAEQDTDLGPIAFQDQYDKVRKYIELGADAGGTLTSVGNGREPTADDLFVKPTIITDVTNDTRVAREEIFGPVVCVMPFSTEQDAIELANDSEYGLVAGIWTENMRQGHRVADALQVGTVWVNEYRNLTYSSPYGGDKGSGIGKENGRDGFEEYLQSKSIWVDLSGTVSNPFSSSPVD